MKTTDDEAINAACLGKRTYSSRHACEKQGSYHKNNGRNNGKRLGVRRCYQCVACQQWHCGFTMPTSREKHIKIIGVPGFEEGEDT